MDVGKEENASRARCYMQAGDGLLAHKYGKPNGHAQKAVMVQRGQVVGTRNTSACSENVSSVFSYWLFSIQSYKISQGSYAWVHNDICIVKERKMCT